MTLITNRMAITLLTCAIFASGCSRPGVAGDGEIKTEDRPVSDFSKIAVLGGYKVKWSCGKPALSISTDQNLLPLIKTVVSGNTLRIDSKDTLNPTKSIVITVSSSSLKEVNLTGGNSFKASQLSGDELDLESAGAAEITVDGSVRKLEADLKGASKLNAKSLQTQFANLSLLGASDADVTVSDTLKVSILGAGSLTYAGNPKSVDKTIAGAGSVRSRP